MKVAALLLILTAFPAWSEVTSQDLLLASRCIGMVEKQNRARASHIVPDLRRANNLAAAFEGLLTLPQSPSEKDMQEARKTGQLIDAGKPDPFSSVSDIMANLNPPTDCVVIIDRLGLLPVVYPHCFPDGCPSSPHAAPLNAPP